MEKHIFLFRTSNVGEGMKLNIYDSQFELTYNHKSITLDLSVLADDTSTTVIYNPYQDTLYPLYNFRELLEVFNLTASEFCGNVQMQGVMQIDKSAGNVFVKIFMPEKMEMIKSDTTDFSIYEALPVDQIHPLDLNFSWQTRNTRFCLEGEQIHVYLYLHRSDFWKEPLYLNHAGQYVELQDGDNHISMKYIPSNGFFVGKKNSRYMGRWLPFKDE